MALLEVDSEALQNLINIITRNESERFLPPGQLAVAYDTFDGSFISPDKPQLSQAWGDMMSIGGQLITQLDELAQGLHNLQRAVQTAEAVTF